MIKIPLPEGIHSFFSNELISVDTIHQKEQHIVHDYSPQRLLDYSRGRYCSHQCLKKLNRPEPVLKDKESGAPIWPEGVTGSISHSQNLAGSIVSKIDDYSSLGLDIETVGRVTADLWELLFTPNEISLLEESDQPSFLSTLLFSAKEAFFKMQFQITHEFLDFHDGEILAINEHYYMRVLKKNCKIHSIPGHHEIGYATLGKDLITYALMK